MAEPRDKALQDYRKKLLEHKEIDGRLKELREQLKELTKQYEKSENDLKALQSVGQVSNNRSESGTSLSKQQMDQDMLLVVDVRRDASWFFVLGFESLIGIVDEEKKTDVDQNSTSGTGKTLLARAVASQLDCNFLKVVSSSIVDKYIGESARLIREMFNYARDHQPCIIFMDEIDAIGGRRFSEGTSADREIQRTLMELLNQMDGFDTLHRVKMIMATNRPDTLDPALLRPGRLDRKIRECTFYFSIILCLPL
ncbi:hypothetical protein JD844_020304 [Phrynosoma platyrhinos]|uniref:AAA+ ATPase domain-containing protein n=1 Tax=Phrynosoma platyrhinos TaxID=52577 RepID=A0ABQ7SSH4_PHRPL|nr:hypothetical protein JD844_020304 [Phrynosoma platyrhinos]